MSRRVFFAPSGQSRSRTLLCTIFFLATAAFFGAIEGCGSSSPSSTPPPNGTPPTNLVYPQTTIVTIVGQAISADTPTVTGSVTTYSISPALPVGLSLSASTGAITGTPTAVTAQTTYTITAANTAGTTTAVVQIVVNAATPPPTNLVYPQTSITATVGQAIATDTPGVTGTVTSYSVSPALPAGLNISASTGAISGTPTGVTAQASYTVTAANSAGTTTATVQITVNAAPPTNLVYPQTSITATAGQAIVTDSPSVTGTVTSYSVSPALPAGLNISASTGAISSTPTSVTAQATYTITAANTAGTATATVQITVNAAPPTNLVYPQTSITATAGQAIVTDSPSVTGTVTSYSVSPALPAGLNLSASTGAISGTPTSVTAQATYTITAANTAGTATATVQITVNAAPPTNLVYPQTSIPAVVGQAIVTDIPTVTGTITSYSVSPALPAGLNISASTGAISGTPTSVTAQATYTITAANTAGTTTAIVQITVNAVSAPPTSLVYPVTTIVVSVGQTIAPDIPVLTGDPVSYNVSPALPSGIGIDSGGTISGVPTAPSPQTSYTVTAANSGGSTTATIAITVNKALPALLDIGHADQIRMLRVSATRLLSQDTNNHWVLWDYAANAKILSGDQVVPPFSVSLPIFPNFWWPVDMAGGIFVIGQTNGLDVRATSDGHLLFQLQSPQIDSAQGGTWWKLATDGSYICNGSQSGLTIWSSTGQQLVTLQGDYSTANAYAAPGQVLVALGPAGQSVIQTISVPSGASATGPAFSGSFNSWFTDGQNFFTTTTAGTSNYTVNTYSSANMQLQASVSLSTIENLTGQGNWFWTYEGFTPGYPLNIYPINGSTPSATYNFDVDTVVIPSANTLGVLPYGAPSASVIDLSGASPVKADYPLPVAYEKAYAATSASQWIVGNTHGVVLDGMSVSTTPRFFGTGQVFSIAGGANYFAVATAIGKIFYYSSSSPTTPAGTINFSSSGLAVSSDGTVLLAGANTSDSQYETDRTLNVYSLPSGNLTYSTPYQFASGSADLVNFSLSGSGTVTGQSVCAYTAAPCTLQAAPTTGGSATWSISTSSTFNVIDGIKLSPDGTLIAVSLAPYSNTSTTNIYQNGLLVTTVPGYAIGWIDNNQLLVNNYHLVQPKGFPPYPVYSNASIYSAAGTLVSSPTLPELYVIQPITSSSIYAPSYNEILSLPSGTVTYSSTVPLRGPAAVAGPYVVFVSGSLIVTDTY
jgi:hypothetical protein